MPRVPVPGGGGPGMGRAAGRGIGGPSGGQPGLSGENSISIYNVVISVQFNFDGDPDPGAAQKKMDPKPGSQNFADPTDPDPKH